MTLRATVPCGPRATGLATSRSRSDTQKPYLPGWNRGNETAPRTGMSHEDPEHLEQRLVVSGVARHYGRDGSGPALGDLGEGTGTERFPKGAIGEQTTTVMFRSMKWKQEWRTL